MQSDNQMRFSDLENIIMKIKIKIKKVKLPGTSKPQDFGATPGYSFTNDFLKSKKLFQLALPRL